MLKIITMSDVEVISHHYAQSKLGYDEPIPEFSTRYAGRLESCLVTPFQRFGKRHLYRGLTGKASMLFYLLIKNHPFQNGNKRIAMTTLMTFLHLNGKWLSVPIDEMYDFAVWIAMGPAKAKDETVAAIEQFISGHLVSRG
jgi:death-on-curing protein